MVDNSFEDLKRKYDSVFQDISAIFQCDDKDIKIINPFNEGKSGDTVLLIRINSAAQISNIGYHVLKIFNDHKKAQTESSKTIIAAADNEMAHISIPSFRYRGENYYLYDVAGEALFHAASLDKTDEYALANRLEKISLYLLGEWNSKMSSAESTPYALIRNWIGEDHFESNSTLNERLRNQISDELSDSFRFNDKVYPNPLFFLISDTSPLNTVDILALFGKIHGDLNLNNVISQKAEDNSNLFYLIDFDHFRESAPLLFDQAYLLYCALLRNSASCTLIEWEENIKEFFECMRIERSVSGETIDAPIDLYMNKHLDAMKTFEVRQQEHNRKSFRIQLFAAHIAVGINFFKKRTINDRLQKMSLLYASEALYNLLKLLEIDFQENVDAPMLHVSSELSSKLWTEINHFSSDNQYILITSGVDSYVSLSCMENLAIARWSAVIEVNGLAENKLRNKVLPLFKKCNNYRFYDLPNDDSMVFDPVSSWIHLFVPKEQKNSALYYRNHFQDIVEKIIKQSIKARENEPIYLIADLNGIQKSFYDSLILHVLSFLGKNTPVKIITFDGHQIEVESDDLISYYCSEYKLSDLSMALYSLKGSSQKKLANPKIPTVEGMVHLSEETFENISNDMELVYQDMIYRISDDGGDSFYHGSPAGWYDLAVGRDVLRYDYSMGWKEKLKFKMEKLTNGASAIVNLYHRAGGGGTTLSKRIAWDMCKLYPTVMLRCVNSQTSERLKEIYSISKKPLLVIVEISDGNISYDVIATLRRELIKRSVRILFLCVSRFFGKPVIENDRIWYLPGTPNQCMSPEESVEMLHSYSRQLDLLKNSSQDDDEDKINEEIVLRQEKLSELTYIDSYEDMRQPFFYGLYTYDKDFQGIDSYVEHNRNLSDFNEKKALEILSFTTLFSQSINLTLNEIALFLFPDAKSSDVTAKVTNWIYDNHLVVRVGRGVRICHPLIAEELLIQDGLIRKGQKDGYNTYFGNDSIIELAIDFITQLTNYYGERSERINIVFREIFTHREMVYEEEPTKFSPFLSSLSKTERCVKVMKYLADMITWNPHYSNHLARLYLYPVSGTNMTPNIKEALVYARDAIERAKNEGNLSTAIHYHVLGKVYTKQCLNVLEQLNRNISVKKMIQNIRIPYNQACNVFDRCIMNDSSGYGITGKLELITMVLRKICRKKGSNINGLLMQPDSGKDREIAKMISNAGDLIGQYYVSYDVITNAFRHACINFYRLIGNISKIEMILRSEAVTSEEILNANRAISTVYMRAGYQEGSFSYDRMSKNKLQEINRLMTKNISMGNDNEQDRIRWFETYRRLSSSNLRTAYSFLMDWPDPDKKMFVCYYRYVFSFVLYNETGEETYSTVNEHLTQTMKLAQNVYGKNVITSLNFYSKNEKDMHIIPRNISELDESKETSILQNKEFRDKNCKVFKGIISSIIDNIVTVKFRCANEDNHFFYAKTPNIDQLDLGKDGYPVKFHLGFSFSGLRAWDVQLIDDTN